MKFIIIFSIYYIIILLCIIIMNYKLYNCEIILIEKLIINKKLILYKALHKKNK